MDYKAEISGFIDANKSNMVTLLQKLARIPSVTGEQCEGMPYGKAVDDALTKALTYAGTLGFDGVCFEKKADIINFNDKKTKLAILCHLDVVPATDDGWTNPPFEPTVRDNMIYGRGVSDNKGPAVAALYALYAIKSLGIDLKHNVMLYLGGSEEKGQRDLADYLKSNSLPEYVFTPDACFPVGNAERGRIVITCNTDFKSDKIISINAGKGINIIPDYAVAQLKGEKIETFGQSTHAAHPSWGENAITALLEKLSELDDAIKPLASCFPHNVFNGCGLGLDGGLDISITQLKIENGKMFFTVDGRVDLDASSEKLSEIIKQNLPYPIEMNVKEPHYVDKKSDVVVKLNKAYEKYTNSKGGTYTLDAMTYAHSTKNGVIFGGVFPGDGSINAHGVDECYSLNSLIESAKIYAGAILEICEIEGGNENE